MQTKSKEIPIFKSNNGFIEKIGSITISQDLEQDILNKEVSFSPVLEKILNNPKQLKRINLMPKEKIKLDSERKLIKLIDLIVILIFVIVSYILSLFSEDIKFLNFFILFYSVYLCLKFFEKIIDYLLEYLTSEKK